METCFDHQIAAPLAGLYPAERSIQGKLSTLPTNREDYPMRLTGKVAIVTGGSRGLGLACAQRFIAEGAIVVLTDIAEDRVKTSADRIGASYVVGDASNAADVQNAVAQTLKRHGQIDILLSNAGILGPTVDFLKVKVEEFDEVMRINVRSQFLFGQAVAHQMIKQGLGGSIINMASVVSVIAAGDRVAYASSKGASAQLTKAMAMSLAPHNIRVNAIGPGTISTDMGQGAITARAGGIDKVLSRTPLGRLGDPSEIASVAAFLASDDASYITGQTIYADGGRLALNYTATPVVAAAGS